MNKTILLDLDDTLIDTTIRQYRVIFDYFSQYNLLVPEYEIYLSERYNNNYSNSQFIETFCCSNKRIMKYELFHTKNIESLKYLAYDKLLVDTNQLKEMKKLGYNFILVSLRKNKENGLSQLKDLGIKCFFSEIFFLPHNKNENPKTKVINQLNKNMNIVAFIGDSVSDFNAANANNVDFIWVETGLYVVKECTNKYTNINEAISEIFLKEKR